MITDDRRDPDQPDRRDGEPRGGRRRQTDKVACPFCGCLQSAVLNRKPTVKQQKADGYIRRRQCGGCGREFPTQEIARVDL